MRRRSRGVPLNGLRQAFDHIRFGAERTLNLRESLPTAAEAVRRADAWLRQQQVQRSGEVLVITGRGNNSADGISVVREAVLRELHALKRRGVVSGHEEHTAGSFVVTLAPVRELWEAPKRRRERSTPPPPSPASLEALGPDMRDMLRELAERALDALGVRERDRFIQEEMLRQFSAVAASVGPGPDRENRLRHALRLALSQED